MSLLCTCVAVVAGGVVEPAEWAFAEVGYTVLLYLEGQFREAMEADEVVVAELVPVEEPSSG